MIFYRSFCHVAKQKRAGLNVDAQVGFILSSCGIADYCQLMGNDEERFLEPVIGGSIPIVRVN